MRNRIEIFTENSPIVLQGKIQTWFNDHEDIYIIDSKYCTIPLTTNTIGSNVIEYSFVLIYKT